MKLMTNFIERFGSNLHLDEEFIVEEKNRFFLLNTKLRELMKEDFFYAGTYLGKIKNDNFFPSFLLLGMMSEGKANKITVDKKTEWLFVCGRDVFKQGITRAVGSTKKGAYTLVVNQYGECLGFGIITADLDRTKRGVAIKNISDIGDFLRREKAK